MFRLMKTPGIRSWMLFGTLLATLPLMGFAAWIVIALVSKEHADDDAELLRRTQAASLAVQHRFDRAAAALQALAVSPSMEGGDIHGLYEEAKRVMARHPDATAIRMGNADGQQLFSTAATWGEKLPVSKAAELESAVFSRGQIVYTPMFIGSVTRRWVMAVSVPVLIRGRIEYSLRMSIPSDAL